MASPSAVSGNIQDLTGSNIAGYATFLLANYGDNIPRVIGTTNVATNPQTIQASAGGALSTNLWGNDNINPAGTFYYVTILDQFQKPINTYAFSITGSTFNLNSASPIATLPVVTPPTGDTTYVRVDLGNENLLPAKFLFSQPMFTSQAGIPSLPKTETLTFTTPTNANIIQLRLVILANETSAGTWTITDGTGFTYLTFAYGLGGLAQTVVIDSSGQGSFSSAGLSGTSTIKIAGSGFTTYHKGYLEVQFYA